MKKNSKIILSIVGLISGLSIIGGTLYFAKANENTTGINNNIINTTGNNSTGNRPSMPNRNNSSDNMGEPPDMNDSTKDSSTTDSSSNNNTNSKSNSTKGERPSMGDSNNIRQDKGAIKQNIGTISLLNIVLISIGSLIFMVSLVYLIMSSMGNNLVFISKDKILIFVLINIVLSGIMSFGVVTLSNKFLLSNNNQNMTLPDMNNQNSTDDNSTTSDTDTTNTASV